jgi:hypothetical protein
MKKIVCESCNNRHGDYGVWIVYNRVVICDTCRLATINYLRNMDFGWDHPWIIEFGAMTR